MNPSAYRSGQAGGSLDFVAVDVETANRNRGSVCAFGLVVVRDGIMIEHHSWLGRPPGRLDWFDPFNIGIHGIHPEDVARQPGFADRLTQAMKVIGDLPVVAHYAAFDIGAIRDGCDADGLVWPNLTYGCTVVLSRRELDLLSYQLPIVAAELGITLEHHHDAGADASAAAQILIALARRRNASTFTDLLAGLRVTSGSVTADRWAGCHRMPDIASRVLPHASPDADPAHPLCGQVMVFTGGLSTMRREDAWTRVALLGATPAKNIST
ncbi:MAG TPA: exonuclease domain-containing protein, partial [Pseudonocardiaceae bacterium]|nr:exonuclease domain-containing protein [Pseudonocardiaceae bacterium]